MMSHIEIDTGERREIEDRIKLLKIEFDCLSSEGKQVFVALLGRHLGQDMIDELAKKP